ncbi:hypothetical protein [Bartonella sp. HY761]|uniref:hypothetical protein n=1 Tax=Bartonella sp. HY761 TaxID=2979330 RepID=UPI00220899A2|nr:hypothetical protein [Bartonella sp. HY761]UXN06809.1 hypothetical protein N6A79_02010 [Bartonella sp. HY761]
MLFHSYIFWGTIRKDSQFNIINHQANEIFADMGLDITHIGYQSNIYDSKGYRKYNRVNKKLISLNEYLDKISVFCIASTGKESDYLYEYDVQFEFLNKIYAGRQGENDSCQLIIKEKYLDDNFKHNIIEKFKRLANYIFDVNEFQHFTCRKRNRASEYIFFKDEKRDFRSINILECEIYK